MPGYQPRMNEDPVWIDGENINTYDPGTGLGVRLTEVRGWDDTPPIRDVRSNRSGQDGEYADNVFLGGRTITLNGAVHGSSWTDLQARKRALAAMFTPRSDETLLKIPDPTVTAFSDVWSAGVENLEPTAWWRFNDLASPPTSNNYDASVLARGDTTHYWELAEASGTAAANSVSGAANPGTIAGNPTLGVTGPCIGSSDTAIDFDGTGDYVTIPYAAALNPAAFTVAAWIWRDVDTGATEVIFNSRHASTAHGFQLRIEAADTLGLWLGDSAVGAVAAGSTATVPTGRWVHVAASFGSGTASVYIDGVLAGSAADAYSPNTASLSSIGTSHSVNALNFNGKIAKVSLHNAVMTSAEIGSLFVKGRPVADTQGSYAGGMIAAPTSATGAITGDTDAAFDFGGTTAAVLVPYAAALNAATFSISGWVKRDADSGGIESIVDTRGSTGLNGYALRIGATDKFELVLADGAAGSIAAASTTSLAVGTYYHVAATFDGTTGRVYVDGVLEASGADTMVANTTAPLRISQRYDGTLLFNGKIDELTYHGSTVLTAAQIAELYDRGIYDYEVYDDEMYSYERASVRVIEPIAFGDMIGSAAMTFQVSVRASDPRVYSDVETSSESGTTGTAARTALVDQVGTYETPATLTVTGPTASSLTLAEPSSGLALSLNGLTLGVSDTLVVDTLARTVSYNATYEGVRTARPDNIALWMLEESAGTTADNIEGTASLDGTYTGTFTLNQTGPVDGISSVALDGASGYVSIPANVALHPSEGNLTFECWVKFDTIQEQRIADAVDEVAFDGWALAMSPTGFLAAFVWNGGTPSFTQLSTGVFPVVATWYHVAMTIESGVAVTLYVDGAYVNQVAIGAYQVPAASSGMRLGRRYDASKYLDGNLSACGLYGSTWSGATVAEMYAAQVAAANSVGAYTYLEAESSRWAHLGTDSSTYTLNSSGLVTGSKLGVSYRDARL